MTHPLDNLTDDRLARRLTSLTDIDSTSASLWKRALPARPASIPTSYLSRDIPAPFLLAAASVLIVFVLAAVILPSLGEARSSARSSEMYARAPSYGGGSDSFSDVQGKASLLLPAPDAPDLEAWKATSTGRLPADADRAAGDVRRSELGFSASQPTANASDLPRQVIRKATIELTTPDVRAAMLKASMILNLATGEFTENSSLTGEGPTAHATLTLRVAAPRLSEVLNSLRALGKVTSEQTTGDDVTDQVVDTDARLRNEQHVEAELLDLLASRKDAPLDDILAVRNQLAAIRESIERLTAQRDQLSHLVSLATILVVITADSAPPPPAPAAGIWDYFKTSVTASWHTGLSALADTIAFLVRIAIGGLIWWLAALTLFLTILHLHRRQHTTAAREPAPTE